MDDKSPVAYHEAGHAVVAWLVGYGSLIERISIVPADDFLGVLEGGSPLSRMNLLYDASPEVGEALKNDGVILQAGPIAQKRFDPASWHEDHGGSDLKTFSDHIRWFTEDPEEREALNLELKERAEVLVNQHWHEVEALATALLERKELTGDETVQLLEAVAGVQTPRSGLCDYETDDYPVPDWAKEGA